jgi:caffeoyl-CoA O-methyltransferase
MAAAAPTPEDIDRYAEAATTAAPEVLRRLDEETHASLTSPQMLSGTVVGRLLETLVWLRRPRLVLEIGTYSGGSALWMGRALPDDGRIVSCELDPERADFAEAQIARAGMAGRIEVRRGPALATIRALEGPLDLVFLDADKTGYLAYYEEVVPRLAPDGLLVADNTLMSGRVLDPEPGDASAAAIAAFNARAASDPRVVATLLTVRDGVTLIRPA